MSGGQGGRGGAWEATQRRQREAALAREGRHVDLGREYAQHLEQEEAERQAERLRLEGVTRERRSLQEHANALAAGLPQADLDRINARFREKLERLPGSLRSFSTEAGLWLSVANEAQTERAASEAERERGPRRLERDAEGWWLTEDGKRILDDGVIRRLEPDDYLALWDTRANTPKDPEHYVYRPGILPVDPDSGDDSVTSADLERVALGNANQMAAGLGSGDTSSA